MKMRKSCGIRRWALLALVWAFLAAPLSGQAAVQEKNRAEGVGFTGIRDDRTVSPVSSAAGKSSVPVAKTKTAFYKKIRENMIKGRTQFQIRYTGSGNAGTIANYNTILKELRKLDSKSTSSDADYLVNNTYEIAWRYSTRGGGKDFTFYITYWESAKQTKAVDKKVKSVLKKLGVSRMTEAARIKAIHDYVADLVSYDRTFSDHSAYGGMVASKHTTVCQGYAGLTYKMLTEAGIKNHIVTGYANGGSHAWNIVKIGKKWYHLDVTFDDPISYWPTIRYDYFLVGSNTMEKDHYIDPEFRSYKYSKKNYNWKKALSNS